MATTTTTHMGDSTITADFGQQPQQQPQQQDELILPPPSCWFADDLAAAAPSSSDDEDDEEELDEASDDYHQKQKQEQQQQQTQIIIGGATNSAHESTTTVRASRDYHPPVDKSRTNGDSSNSIQSKDSSHFNNPSRHQKKDSIDQISTYNTHISIGISQHVSLGGGPLPPPSSSSSSSSPPLTHNKTPPLASFRLNPSLTPPRVVAAPSPSWKEISSQVLPSAAKELLSSSLRRVCHTARLSYAKGRWHRKYSDLGNNSGGFFRPTFSSSYSNDATMDGTVSSSLEKQLQQFPDLPPFSNLPWVDRQMVREWRTYLPEDDTASNSTTTATNEAGTQQQQQQTSSHQPTVKIIMEEEDFDFDRARTLVPQTLQRPRWQKADICYECSKPFGPTRLRHHCRLCGFSFCQMHSGNIHKLPHLDYDPDVPERVCDPCKRACLLQNLAERVAWRLARCRDLEAQQLTPYFELGIDSLEQAALRIAHAALATARSIPLGAQATVAVETVEVLRKYGLNGIYGIMLRKEFLAAADLLRKALGINKTAWPLSVHELSAAIFYALAQHRAMRGINPDREEIIHTLINTDGDDNQSSSTLSTTNTRNNRQQNDTIVIDETDDYNPGVEHLVSLANISANNSNNNKQGPGALLNANKLPKDTMTCNSASGLPFTPVCTPVADYVLNSLIFYAPIALTFIYATKEVDMQLLAAQQGWKLLYACLNPDKERDGGMVTDIPASAVFVHEQQKTACLAIRGTATIHDVVTDLRQVPVPFPDMESVYGTQPEGSEGWTNVTEGKGLAVCGMASAAMNLFREHIDVLLHLVRQGYKVRITGHSLGGGVATLIGVLILKELEDLIAQEKLTAIKLTELLRVYAYGPPASADASLAAFTESFVTTAILHDDVVPRLTPTSCRGLLKHLLHIRETWVHEHMTSDILAIGERASLAWAPRWRSGFTITSSSKIALKKSSRSIKKFCQKKISSGTKQILSVAIAAATGTGQQQSTGVMLLEEMKQDTRVREANDDTGVHVEDPTPISQVRIRPNTDHGDLPAEDDIAGAETPGAEPKLLVEMMGGLDNRSNAVIIDGDEFFEADENLIESEEESLATTEMFVDAFDEARSHELEPITKKVASEMKNIQQAATTDNRQGIQIVKEGFEGEGFTVQDDDNDDDDGPGAVILEETALPRMFIPGKIVHIYSHRGVYKAAYVPRAFRELRRISLAGNMLTDHTTQAYYESLLEIRSARHAQESPPRWTAFDEDDTCSCCASRFTWASTSDSEAQNARDKHNCRSCGTLVCNPCALNRIPLPSIGITVPVRVCDRCYNDLGGVFTGIPLTKSFTEESRLLSDGPSNDNQQNANTIDRPERQRDRRSTVVDDLARRIKESALASP